MPTEIDHAATVVGAAILGPIFGSFVTALSYRVPRGENIAAGRSRCAACGHVLTARDLVPIASWITTRGRCRHCGVAISPRYPIIEGVCLALFVGSALLIADPIRVALACTFVIVALTLAIIDFEHQQLPNVLVGLLLPFALAWRWHSGPDLREGVIAAAFVFAALFAMDQIFVLRKGEGALGGGDMKIITLAALCLTFPLFLVFLFVGSASGLIFGLWWRRHTGQARFPFGVTLVAAWWLCLVLPTLPDMP